MVVVEYLYEEMKRLVDLPLEKMIDGLNTLGAPSEYESETKKIISELTPNRPDWYSMEGLARALKAYYKGTHPEYKVKGAQKGLEVFVDPSVSGIRPFTACAIVRGLSLNDQRVRDIILLQEKLIGTLGRKVKKFGIGFYPLQAIMFPVRYTAMEPKKIIYRPLDFEKAVDATVVLAQHKKGQQYGHLIQKFDKYTVFVDAENKIMALIPIVNSEETGRVDESTKDVFIEVTGVELTACQSALNIITCTLCDMGGTAQEVKVHYGKKTIVTPDLSRVGMEFDLEKANRVLGLELKEKDAAKLLTKMGYIYAKGKVLVPPYRADIIHEVDVTEDLAIAYGYNNFVPTLPDFFTPGRLREDYKEYHETMRGMGFLETRTFILTNKESLKKVGYIGKVLEISNPATEDFTLVRPIISQSVMETMALNKTKGLPVKVYEVGNVYQDGVDKRMFIFGVMDKLIEFSEIRGYVQRLMNETGQRFELKKEPSGFFDEETGCSIWIDGKKRGSLGKVKESVTNGFGIEFEVYICEIML